MSMVRVKSYKVGDMLPVRAVHGGYPLPEGLPDGAGGASCRVRP